MRYLRRVLLTRARARRPIHSWDLDRTRGRGGELPKWAGEGKRVGCGEGLGEGIGEGWLVVIRVLWDRERIHRWGGQQHVEVMAWIA